MSVIANTTLLAYMFALANAARKSPLSYPSLLAPFLPLAVHVGCAQTSRLQCSWLSIPIRLLVGSLSNRLCREILVTEYMVVGHTCLPVGDKVFHWRCWIRLD